MQPKIRDRARCRTVWAGLFLAVVMVAGTLPSSCGSDNENPTETPEPTSVEGSQGLAGIPEGMTANVSHTFVPFDEITTKIYEGEERDPEEDEAVMLRVEESVQPDPIVVNGFEVRVVEVKDFEGDEMVELTMDYYAQGTDGTVYYVGEDVEEYEDGESTGHGGAWLAGVDGNLPGIFMLPEPEVGDVFEQERAPGIAEDTSTVVGLDVEVTVPAGTFTGCMETEDVDPLAESGGVEHKVYCPGVGLVREESEDSFIELISYE